MSVALHPGISPATIGRGAVEGDAAAHSPTHRISPQTVGSSTFAAGQVKLQVAPEGA